MSGTVSVQEGFPTVRAGLMFCEDRGSFNPNKRDAKFTIYSRLKWKLEVFVQLKLHLK